ncbi:MAG: hypothetical protein ACOC3I_08010, partial [Verrucomicrobiota bacterium]
RAIASANRKIGTHDGDLAFEMLDALDELERLGRLGVIAEFAQHLRAFEDGATGQWLLIDRLFDRQERDIPLGRIQDELKARPRLLPQRIFEVEDAERIVAVWLE